MHSSHSKSPSSPGRSRQDSIYRSSRKSPRGRSRSPIQSHNSSTMPSSSSSRRRSISKERHQPRDFDRSARVGDRNRHSPEMIQSHRSSQPSQEAFTAVHQPSTSLTREALPSSSVHERHNPGPTGPLPGVEQLQKIEIQVKNPAADGNSPQVDSVKESIEDVKIPRRYGEGDRPLFEFLTPVNRLVVFKGGPSEVPLLADDNRRRVHNSSKSSELSERRDIKSSPSHSNYVTSCPRSRSTEAVRVKPEWDRGRDLERNKYHEQDHDKYKGREVDRYQDRNGDRDIHRADDTPHHSRRSSRDGERPRYDVEPYRFRDRERGERERDRNRERGRDRDFDRVRERERVRGRDGDSKDTEHDTDARSKSDTRVKSESIVKSDPGTSEDSVERRPRDTSTSHSHARPHAPQYMDHGPGPRMMGPGFGPMRPPMGPMGPFMGRPPFGPYRLPPGVPPPMFYPPRMRPPRF